MPIVFVFCYICAKKKKRHLMPLKHPPEISTNLPLPVAETEIRGWLLI